MTQKSEKSAENVDDPEVIVEEPQAKAISAEEGVESLKKQLEAEKSRREAAERQAQEAATQVFQAKAEVDDTNLQLVSNAIETIKGHTASLRAAYAQAMSSGDYNKAADIQIEMSTNAAKLLQLENGKQAMAERPKAPPPVADPVEALAKQLGPRSAAWIRAHPECARDPKLTRKMFRAHEDAVDDGLEPDSDRYFAYVESRLGLNEPAARAEEEDGMEMAAKPVARRSSPAAAPVSRTTPGSSGNPRVIRLSAEEREVAKLNKMTDQEYWEQKQRVARDSRYN